MDSLSDQRSKRVIGGFVTAVLLASVLSVAAVSAQTSSGSECSGDFVTGVDGIQLLVGSVTTADVPLATPIPAGTYDLNAASFDEHDGRESIDAQPQEQWVIEFLDVNGNVLATSQPTADLADFTPAATWSGSIGSLTLPADATSARIVHAAPTSSSPNSVFPVCFGATSTGDDAVGGDDDGNVGRAVGGDDDGADVDATDPVTSTIILDFDSDADATSSAAVICDLSADSDTGDQIDLVIDGIEPGTECIVAYPTNFDCTVAVDPASTIASESPGDLTIALPADEAVTVLVDIDCTDADVAAVDQPAVDTPAAPVVATIAPAAVDTPTTTAPAAVDAPATTVAPAAAAVTTTTTAPQAVTTTTVAGAAAATVTTTTVASSVTTTTVAPSTQNAPTAPAAQPRVGTPSFTG